MTTKNTILITGATSGIGRFAALHLARLGHRVIATGRRVAALDELTELAREETLPLHALSLDVTDASSIAKAVESVDTITSGYGLDVLINNAGWGLAGPVSEVSDADVRRQYDTNVFGLLAVTRAFLPQMVKRGSGRVLNVTSVGGRMTFPLFGVYNSTKYAVESLSDALRNELKPLGIHVVLIEPGVIQTEFGTHAMNSLAPYAEADSPFKTVLERAADMQAQADKYAVGPECIANAMQRAITSRSPSARYMAPFRYRIMYALYKLTPTRLNDRLLRRITGLTSKKMKSLAAHRTPKTLAAGTR